MLDLPLNLIRSKMRPLGGPWCWAADIQISSAETVYIVNNLESITFRTNAYKPFPFTVASYSLAGDGSLPNLRASIDNVVADVSALARDRDMFLDRPLTLWLLDINYLDDDDYALRIPTRIIDSGFSERGFALQLSQLPLFDVTNPASRISPLCRWAYGGERCGYDTSLSGALPTCDKSLFGQNGCIAHGESEDDLGVTRMHPQNFGNRGLKA